jgi:ABC-type phosphate transport system substrate-binding protein
MKNKITSISSAVFVKIGLLLLVLLVTPTMAFVSPGDDALVVIINEANPAAAMTASQVKIIYTRKISRRWKELNKNVLPADRKGEPESKKRFTKDVLQMTTAAMDQFFSEREYQNQETPPVKLGSDEEMIKYVEENPGAIGYVMKSSLGSNRKVKVVLTVN